MNVFRGVTAPVSSSVGGPDCTHWSAGRCEVEWSQPIGLLFIDGLYDYASVAADFAHFEHWVAPGTFVVRPILLADRQGRM